LRWCRLILVLLHILKSWSRQPPGIKTRVL
jgi:hypothetical protein